ncbi:MAG: type II secretion system protein [Candidatus Sacchiramonaceae bacterium]|nr:type II secretion system protein [Candidatus Saccharimonadaceae bacterium]
MNRHKYNHNISHQSGFTIIEVVLVLAIAGLIFLMVFIALPALQRNQRDTQRKNDMSRIVTSLNSYKANNRGQLPNGTFIGQAGTGTSDFVTNYLRPGGEPFNDPSGIRILCGLMVLGLLVKTIQDIFLKIINLIKFG